jgi:hypothetical protein
MVVYYITIITTFLTSLLAQSLANEKIRNNPIDGQASLINKNSFFVFLTFAILTLVAGFRWRVGTDYVQYSRNYDRYILEIREAIISFNEPGINILAKVSSWIYDDYATMFFLAAFITIGLTVKTISKYSTMFTLSILLYIFIGSWHGSFNGVRQFLACAVIFAGHRYIFNREFIKYLFVVLIASAFHISALIMIMLYFTPKIRLKIKHWIFILIGIFVVLYSYEFVFQFVGNFRYDGDQLLETSDYAQRQVSIVRIMVSFAPLLLFFTITSKKNLSNEDLFYINLLFINAAVSLATFNSAYLARFAIYTNIFTTLALPRLLIVNDKNLSFLLRYLIIILYGLFWYIDVRDSSSLYNFQWIFNR